MNKVVNNLLDTIQQSREEWESESARAQLSQTSSVADTQLLIAAIGTGQSLAPDQLSLSLPSVDWWFPLPPPHCPFQSPAPTDVPSTPTLPLPSSSVDWWCPLSLLSVPSPSVD